MLLGCFILLTLQVKPADLRRAVGCIVSEEGSPPRPSLVKLLEANGYREIQLPVAENAIQTTFPWRNRLSIYIAMKRVWNKLINFQIVRITMSNVMHKIIIIFFFFFTNSKRSA